MKKIFSVLVYMIVLLAGCSIASEQEEDIVRLGAVLPLTGDFAPLGIEAQRGMEMALDELKERDDAVQFEILYEDDESLDAIAAVNGTRKLLDVEDIDAGMTLIVEESYPIAPLFDQAQKSLLVLWDADESIQESGDFLFSNGFSIERAGERMAEYLYYRLQKESVAILAHQTAWAEIITPAFIEEFEQLGGKVVYESWVSVAQTDFRTIIEQIKNSDAEAVYFPLIPMGSVDFLKQAKETDLDLPLLTGDPFLPFAREAAGESAEGVYFTDIYTDNDLLLQEKYRALFGEEAEDVRLVSFGYDGVMKMKEALQEGEGNIQEGFLNIYGESQSANRLQRIYMMNNGEAVELR